MLELGSLTDRMELGIAASPGVLANIYPLTLVLQCHPGIPMGISLVAQTSSQT